MRGVSKKKFDSEMDKLNKRLDEFALSDKEPVKSGTKDKRLDKLVPLFVDIIGRLLAAKGMLRYRKDFTNKVREIMDGKVKKD